jgi:regulator of PEP synthase PpsR (kinase-PPPase family)
LSQFPDTGFEQQALPFVDSHEKVREAVETINRAGREAGCRPLVFCTFVDDAFNRSLSSVDAEIFDLVTPFIHRMEQALGQTSSHKPGQSHSISDFSRYQQRIEAVNFAMRCDDGLRHGDYERATLILVGPSRSGKTPTCLYLALHFGFYPANYPLTEEDFSVGSLPKPLAAHKSKTFGLIIDPLRLHQIRTERRPGSDYASLARCRQDVSRAERIFRANGIPFCDSTNFSVEELGSTIKHQMGLMSPLY